MVQAFLIPHILVPPIWGLGSHIYFNSFDGEHLFKVVIILLKLVKAVSRSFGGISNQELNLVSVTSFHACQSAFLISWVRCGT